MDWFAEFATTIHGILLWGFVSVTTLLLLVTLANRLRIHDIRMTWRRRGLAGVPVIPAVFLGLLVVHLTTSGITGIQLPSFVLAGYIVGGLFWFGASLLSTTVVVSEYGIFRNASHACGAIAWGQIIDYFQYEKGTSTGYAFFYEDEAGERKRFEILIPFSHAGSFQQLLEAKLDSRFSLEPRPSYGKTALEG